MSTNLDILRGLQRAVEQLYEVRTDLDVGSYVVDSETREQLPGARPGLPEQLFVRTSGDAIEMALYVEPTIVSDLARDHPRQNLHAGNIENFCVALEGVSHFVFLAWRAQVEWPVTALELEIQAEVDKFILSWMWMVEQGRPLLGTGQALQKQLFEKFELHDDVPNDEVDRYKVATQAAKRFCARLMAKHGRDYKANRLQADARQYFRQGLPEKLRAA